MFAPIIKEGVGLHTGIRSKVVVKTGVPGSGVVLARCGVNIQASPDSIDDSFPLATTLFKGNISVSTVEHLFSALCAYGETDVSIDIDGPEIPILDGSALLWAQALENNGASAKPRYLSISNHVEVLLGESVARVTPLAPGETPSINVEIDFDCKAVGKQSSVFFPESSCFIEEIAPARTFALEFDVPAIKRSGFGQGGTLDNALIIGDDGPLNQGGFRMSFEPAKHKLLDALGDLFLLGGIPRAKVELYRPGHSLMHALAVKMEPLVDRMGLGR